MGNLDQYKGTSDFLKKEDLGFPNDRRKAERGIDVKIAKTGEQKYDGELPKLTIGFAGKQKMMVVNATNTRALCAITGAEDDQDLIGHWCNVYVDFSVPNPSGGPSGGLRIRSPMQDHDETAAKAAVNDQKREEDKFEAENDPDAIPF